MGDSREELACLGRVDRDARIHHLWTAGVPGKVPATGQRVRVDPARCPSELDGAVQDASVADPVAWLEHPHALQSWTAIVNSVPIGQVTLTDADPDDDAARACIARTDGSPTELAIVVRLFVDPAHRSSGAGRLLMAAALDHAHQVGRAVALDVMSKTNVARPSG